jgi:membrane protein YdbS with pleckstrin-like domain
VRQSAALADHLDTALVFLAGLLAVVGVLLALRAVLASSMTRYDVYQRRIDVASGVLNRHRTSAWLFEMQDVQLRQPPWLTLSRNAEIRIRLQDKSKVRIVGLGALHQQIALREELRDAALRERRALKSVWV